MAREGLMIYHEYAESIGMLSDAQAGALLKALLAYSISGEVRTLNGTAKILYPLLRWKIDRDIQSYEETCERNRRNGAKGGRPSEPSPRNTEGKTSQTHKNRPVILENPENPTETETVTETETEAETETETETVAVTETGTEMSTLPVPPRGTGLIAYSCDHVHSKKPDPRNRDPFSDLSVRSG